MSFRVFFAFSQGLSEALHVPPGTLASITSHVEEVEQTLGLKRERYKDNPAHWGGKAKDAGFPKVDDKTLCETVERHNAWVECLYVQFENWSKTPPNPSEEITPAQAEAFWHGLERLKVDPHRWTREFYRARMDELYEAMRGREAAGMTFDAKTLTPQQAAAVFNLFDQYLDAYDLRLDVPKGHDYLASSYDGGYDWCTKCGAVTPEDGEACSKRKCPLREELAHLER